MPANDGIPEDLRVGPGPIRDFDEVYDFVRATNIAQSGRPLVSRDILEAFLSMPDFDQARDMRFVRDEDGALIGIGWVERLSPYVEPFATGFVAADRLGQGIGSFLLDWEMAVSRKCVAMAPRGARVTVKTAIDPNHGPSVALVNGQGFKVERFFLEMRIDFDGVPPVPQPMPGRLRLVGYDPESDLDRMFDAIDEAFRDHYGYVERPRREELARFSKFIDIPGFDHSLIWMVVAGDEVVGSIVCFSDHEGDASVGYVGILGVRRPWRSRGVAGTLLAVCFDEFARRGKKSVSLHVDADSLTGATRLYESVGMREVHRTAGYELELRPGRLLTVT